MGDVETGEREMEDEMVHVLARSNAHVHRKLEESR